MRERSSKWLPALAIGLGIAAGLFYLRARLTRPEVPTPVAKTVERFAPGVTIAGTVEGSVRHVSDLHWVDDVGFVGRPDAMPFDEVRLVPRRPTGAALPNDRRAKIDYVELVALHESEITRTMRELAAAFDTTVFHEGCLDPASDGQPYRQVRYFITRHDRGGAAVINDWPAKPPADTTARPWSLVVWIGKFAGSATLKGHYVPTLCSQ